MTPEEQQALMERLLVHAWEHSQNLHTLRLWIPALVDDIIVPLLEQERARGRDEDMRAEDKE